MSQNRVPTLEFGRRWDPASVDAALQKFVRVGLVIEKSDRSYRAESGRVKDEELGGRNFNDDIVSELILGDDVFECRRRFSSERPEHSLLQRLERADLVYDVVCHGEDRVSKLT